VDPSLLGALPTPPPSLPGPEEAVHGKDNAKKNAERYMFRFGLENKRGECFRNSGLTCLLHTPIFYSFLIGHAEDHAYSNDRSVPPECLTCMFQDVAKHYYPAVGENRAILYGKLDDVFQHYRKQFWGPHSNLKKYRPETRVGPDGDAGGNVVQYTTWLIHYLAKQTHKIPRNGIDEHQLLKHMFWTSFVAHKTCRNRHRQFLWRKDRSRLQMNTSHPVRRKPHHRRGSEELVRRPQPIPSPAPARHPAASPPVHALRASGSASGPRFSWSARGPARTPPLTATSSSASPSRGRSTSPPILQRWSP
jgi:hypothetical protein